jgi:hypothetical protein
VASFWATLIGTWSVWLSYNMSVTRGRHRRQKRGLLDYGDSKWVRDMAEVREELGNWKRGWRADVWA